MNQKDIFYDPKQIGPKMVKKLQIFSEPQKNKIYCNKLITKLE